MDFELNEQQIMIRDMAGQFAKQQLEPNAAKWDAEKIFPIDVLRQAAELGFAGIYVGEEFGGSNLSRLEAALIFEQLSRGCVASAAFLSIHNMASWMIDTYGNHQQRARFLPDLMSMQTIASYCLTEPGSGSDAASLSTKAVRDGDGYVLNGTKAFISGAGVSHLYLIMARTGEAGSKGISTFIVPKDTAGLSFGANEHKMGWNAQPTAAVILEDCRVPVDNRLGKEGDGFAIAMSGLDGGRVNIGCCSLGGASFAYDLAREYTATRTQFGKPIAGFQASQFKLADMATELEAARMMLYRAAAAIDTKDPRKTSLAAMAKRFATDTGFKVANDALQLHGGYGYLRDYPLERIVRDLRVHQILEGTNEIMRVIIARQELKT
ncbi:MAG: acyl-CoA dehydrogenase family protein [Robiginitomaculum sp.]|nr:acyl-CoA dehydrogenase family protein [Robiginitomaculum sp.]